MKNHRDYIIAQIAARLRMPTGTVRLVVDAWEKAAGAAAPVYIGGGVYELADGTRVKGKANAMRKAAQLA